MDTINWLDDTTRRYLTGAVARPNPSDPADSAPRVFYVDEHTADEHGIIPLLVRADVPGYTPMLGANPPDSTWHWGATIDEAWAICDLVNAELFDLSHPEAMAVVGSSILAQGSDDDEDDDPWDL